MMQVQKPSKKEKLELQAKIDVIKNKIRMEANKYKDNADAEGEVKNAFVTFRSMEGAARLKSAYNYSRMSVCCTRCCCCCVDKETYNRKLFHGQWLKVEQSVEPSLIIWENLGLSMKNRCLRTTGTALISLLLLLATTLLILYVKVFETDLKQDDVICGTAGSSITLNEAWTDYQKPDDEVQNLMYCYCRNIFW